MGDFFVDPINVESKSKIHSFFGEVAAPKVQFMVSFQNKIQHDRTN